VRIARTGGSSVFMLVATKAGRTEARQRQQDLLANQLNFDGMAKRIASYKDVSKKTTV